MRAAARLSLAIVLGVGLTGPARPVAAQQATAPVCHVPTLLRAVRDATGGAAWDRIGETVARGEVTYAGLNGRFRVAIDRRRGRSAVALDVPPLAFDDVFDGTTAWTRGRSRGVHPHDSPEAKRSAVTAAYLARADYLRPGAENADLVCLVTRSDGTRTFDVVRARPRGGNEVELWFDARAHTLDHALERRPTLTQASRFGDYRDVAGVKLPFRFGTGDDVSKTNDVTYEVAGYDVLPAPRDADFARPAEPQDYRIDGNAASTTVPFTQEGGFIIVPATVDGKGPFPFIFDTGGRAILTRETATALGVRTVGAGSAGGAGEGRIGLQYAVAQNLRIGEAQIDAPTFAVIPYGYAFRERGPRPEKAGILGLEVFERFTVRIDYAHLTLTLTPRHAFRYAGAGAAVPIVFQQDIPLAEASVDGVPGLFGIDTGNSGGVVLFGPFLNAHGFPAHYGLGLADLGSGTGGGYTQSRHRLGSLTIGGAKLHGIIANFVALNSGAFASLTEAGNIGYDVLANFTETFDYAHGTMYLEPRTPPAIPRPFDRSGLRISKPDPETISVDRVYPNSPASEAGIVSGDAVVAAEGVPVVRMSSTDLFDLLRGPVGSVVHLTVRSNGRERPVTLTLRDLL